MKYHKRDLQKKGHSYLSKILKERSQVKRHYGYNQERELVDGKRC